MRFIVEKVVDSIPYDDGGPMREEDNTTGVESVSFPLKVV
jgi:hypothetical protein